MSNNVRKVLGTACIILGVICFFWGIIFMANRDSERRLASPQYQCSRVYGVETRDYAMCVYELPRGLRVNP